MKNWIDTIIGAIGVILIGFVVYFQYEHKNTNIHATMYINGWKYEAESKGDTLTLKNLGWYISDIDSIKVYK